MTSCVQAIPSNTIKCQCSNCHTQNIQRQHNKAKNRNHVLLRHSKLSHALTSPQTASPTLFHFPLMHLSPLLSSCLPTEVILQAGSANGRGLVLRTLQVRASVPGQQGGTRAQHGHLGRGSGWLTFHLGSRRLGGLAESLLKTVEGEGSREERK